MFNNNLVLSFFVVNSFKIKEANFYVCLFEKSLDSYLLSSEKDYYIFLTLAAPGPFGPSTISNSTLSPSARVLNPSD